MGPPDFVLIPATRFDGGTEAQVSTLSWFAVNTLKHRELGLDAEEIEKHGR
jgi:hypothetical protein